VNIIEIDWEKKIVKSEFKEWHIVSNNNNKHLLLQREENNRYHAAEADVKKKHIWEVKEITHRAPGGELFIFDEETGITKL